MANVPLHPHLQHILLQWLKIKIGNNNLLSNPIGGAIFPILINFIFSGLQQVIYKIFYQITFIKKKNNLVKLKKF